MQADILLGLQWGDEGKGKIVDFMAPRYKVVARFQGGPNAGHTLEFGDIKHVLHQIPSGIFREDIKNIIGNGVVLDPVAFKKEIDSLSGYGLDLRSNLFISRKAHLILPTHILLDQALEKSKGDKKIGSTLKGIGPTYQDKISRTGLRVGDLLSDNFESKIRERMAVHYEIIAGSEIQFDRKSLEAELMIGIEFLKTFNLADTDYMVNEELQLGNNVLCEGAQGSMLDVDFGSYPFVTSSNTTASGACSGLGISPNKIKDVYGIFKAYGTRVGSGPFPAELFNEIGDSLRKVGNEYGATTGRPRRCGWLDLPALKYSIMLNGVTKLFMMKADVLSVLNEIKVCTEYELKGKVLTDKVPFGIVDDEITPVYKIFPGWKVNLERMRKFDELPGELQNYITFLEEQLGVPIMLISVGPRREQTLVMDKMLA
jgi:adenylosuccinate synthase